MYERYCALRDRAGLNDSEVARATGIARSAFTDWRKGVFTPKMARIEKLAAFFGVPVSYFFDTEGATGPPERVYSALVREVIDEAEKANTDDLRLILENLKRLNELRKEIEGNAKS